MSKTRSAIDEIDWGFASEGRRRGSPTGCLSRDTGDGQEGLSLGIRSNSVIGRYYDPATGQFLSVDPLVAQTQQAYVYVEDDPVNAIDPTGLLCSVGKSANSIVNTYLRKNGRTIWLRCGQKGSSGWGYRHIVEGKHFGGNVNGFVRQYFIGAAVFEGTLVESGRNIVYQEAFHCGIFQCGGTYNFRVNVVIKNTTNNIVTAYITNGKLDALQWGPGGPF